MSVRDDTLDPSKLTRTEFAVVRAYAQGMAAVDIANRYLLDPDEEEALTEHQAVQRILRLRDRLVQFALQNNRPDIAAMFDSLKGRSNVAMDRRVDALSSLERLSPGRPALDHAVSLWFGPSLSRRLAAGGIARIGDLVERVNRRGAAWWRGVPRLGAKSADVVRHWLERQRDTLRTSDGGPVLGPQVGALVAPSQRPPMSPALLDDRLVEPVPLEYMLSETLSGSWRSDVGEELQWVRQWLDGKRPGSHTWASYRREAERLLLWAARRQRPLRTMTAEDLTAYWAFLADPQPAAFWQGPAGPRDRKPWRPFEGGLRDSSRQAAMRVIRALFGWLRQRGLLAHHPFDGFAMPVAADAAVAPVSAIAGGSPGEGADEGADERDAADSSDTSVAAFRRWLDGSDGTPIWRTANAAAYLLGDCGLRIGEVVVATGGHLRLVDGGRWLVRPRFDRNGPAIAMPDVGTRQVDINLAMLSEDAWGALSRHWTDRGLAADRLPDSAPLLGPLMLPPTSRGQAKRASQPIAGYSPSGLDRLLRAAWRDFVALPEHADHRAVRFTPRMLVRRPAGAETG
ncbi:recombinase XerD [Cupriavidus gilardii]|uniref:site-specific integrase n=1 Tax=Cupriavidus gilardii TaxID=82541 RepID=UPI001EE51066|nr:site-specific integrase [Cupriavidus gilardii]MCG5261983.1 site-specific integrase [Cupriavidus gilardii]MDF9430151.1 recombinase XerD [Cupriavidus gilardii]